MDQHQWAIYEQLVYYRDNDGRIHRRDIEWTGFVEFYILSIGKTWDSGRWNVPYGEIWCVDYWIYNVIKSTKIYTDKLVPNISSYYGTGFYNKTYILLSIITTIYIIALSLTSLYYLNKKYNLKERIFKRNP